VRFFKFGTQNTVPYCQKNTLLQTAFSAILPTGRDWIISLTLASQQVSLTLWLQQRNCYSSRSTSKPNPTSSYWLGAKKQRIGLV